MHSNGVLNYNKKIKPLILEIFLILNDLCYLIEIRDMWRGFYTENVQFA